MPGSFPPADASPAARRSAYAAEVPRIVSLLLVLVACGVNPAFDEPGATTTPTPAPTTTAVIDPITTTSTTTLDPSTTESIVSADGTTLVPTTTTNTDPTTTGSTSDAATTGEPEPEPEHLQPFDPDGCEQPLWCISNNNIDAPVSTRLRAAACFELADEGAHRLTKVDYKIARIHGTPMDPALEIRRFDADDPTPGMPIVQFPLNQDEIQPGWHARTFDTPIDLQDDGFCVVLLAGGPDSQLGVAVDPGHLGDDSSFIRSDGPACTSVAQWADIHDLQPEPTPKGGWCIAADVVSG